MKQSLGQKLKNTITEYKNAGITSNAEMAEIDLDVLRKDAAYIKEFADGLQRDLIAAIEAEKIPRIEVKVFTDMSWVSAAFKRQAKHQHIWNDMASFFRKEGLELQVQEDHDSGGRHSWVIVTLDPNKPKTRGGSSGGGTGC